MPLRGVAAMCVTLGWSVTGGGADEEPADEEPPPTARRRGAGGGMRCKRQQPAPHVSCRDVLRHTDIRVLTVRRSRRATGLERYVFGHRVTFQRSQSNVKKTWKSLQF